jgi:hypothetical protein
MKIFGSFVVYAFINPQRKSKTKDLFDQVYEQYADQIDIWVSFYGK